MTIALILFSCKEEKKITTISLRESECRIVTGETRKLTCTYTPFDVDVPLVRWTSSDPDVVQIVNANELECEINGGRVGNAMITCTELSSGNNLQATCYVEVFPGTQFTTEQISIEKGKHVALSEYISGSTSDIILGIWK